MNQIKYKDNQKIKLDNIIQCVYNKKIQRLLLELKKKEDLRYNYK